MNRMLRKILIAMLLVILSQPATAQLERYKFYVVPLQFDGFKEENQFRTSTLIKFLFTEYGFPAVYDSEIPAEWVAIPCKGLRVQIMDDSSLLRTKVKLALQDCNGQVVFETMEGSSKLKDFELAYREAIEEAFASIAALGYSYVPSDKIPTEPTTAAAVAGMKGTLPDEAPQTSAAAETAALAVAAETITATEVAETWYAQPTPNGFQLVDSAPSIQMKLVNTAQEDTFIAMVDEAPMGMVYKKDGDWWHEYYKDGKAMLRKLQLKF